jgi:Rrf2 family protein
MLRITKAEDQALRLAMNLAGSRKRQTLTVLAEAERLPEPTVAKLLGLLRRGGVVVAHRGRNGGYGLAGEPEAVSVADVLRCLGSEPAPPHPCVEQPQAAGDCPRVSDCGLRSVWRHLQNQVTALLESTSLADLLEREKTVSGHVNRVWPEAPGTATVEEPKLFLTAENENKGA